MVNRPSVPEIITVNSETLQTQIRDLLPSQNGFGSELQATNIITPIIDLTAAAEGSSLSTNLQTALAFGSQTSTQVSNTTTTLENTPGFYRVFGTLSQILGGSTSREPDISISDGLSTKFVYKAQGGWALENQQIQNDFDFVVFLRSGDSLTAQSPSTANIFNITTRQIATGDGTLVQPNGFPL